MGSEVPLVDLIDKLGQEVMSSRSKNPAVLYLAAQCCRAMAGQMLLLGTLFSSTDSEVFLLTLWKQIVCR